MHVQCFHFHDSKLSITHEGPLTDLIIIINTNLVIVITIDRYKVL